MKVAILTCFMDFRPGYSLTGIVTDQARMLAEHGHEVHLFLSSKYDQKRWPLPSYVIPETKIPFTHLKDYMSLNAVTPEHKDIIKQTATVLAESLQDIDVAFTHDFMFTGWNVPYGQGTIQASRRLPKTRFLHWIHSIPTGARDYWNLSTWGQQHRLIYPNEADKVHVAEQYRGSINDVVVIPHPKDLRSFFEFDDETCQFVKDYPAIQQADYVQIYPASVDRLETKRVKEVMMIMSKIKKAGFSVFLVIAAQWATTTQQAQEIGRYKTLAEAMGIEKDVVWIPDWQGGKYKVGLPHKILRSLMMYSNLFIFPTRDETFGLVLPEVLIASGALPVLNKSLDMQLEISGYNCLNFDFGSWRRNHEVDNLELYCETIANHILARANQNEALMAKRHMIKNYNWNNLYNRYYHPIMVESESWI